MPIGSLEISNIAWTSAGDAVHASARTIYKYAFGRGIGGDTINNTFFDLGGVYVQFQGQGVTFQGTIVSWQGHEYI